MNRLVNYSEKQNRTSFSCCSYWLLLGLFFPLVLCAQSAQSSELLQSAWEDQRLQAYQRELDFFTNNRKLAIPRLDEFEFRTETHEFSPSRQEYAIRLQFNTTRQIRVQQRVNQKELALHQIRRDAYLEELLFNRYQLLIDIWYQRQALALVRDHGPILADQENVIQTRIREEGESHYDDWLKLEDDRLLYQQEERLLTQQMNTAHQQCSRWLNRDVDSLLIADWPTVAQLERKWLQWQSDTLVLPLAVQEQQTISSIAGLELAAEQAEERNRLNFLQLRYRGVDNPALREQLTLGVGVTLPFRSANSVKEQYLQLEQMEEENQELERTREWLDKLRLAEAKMATHLELYQGMTAAREDYALRFAPGVLRQRGITRPETFLQAANGLLKRDEQLLEQEKLLYEAYLDVLLLSGRLIARPQRNWLSVGESILSQ